MNIMSKEIKAFSLNFSAIYRLIINNINLLICIIMLICGISIGSHAVGINNGFLTIINCIFAIADSFIIEFFRYMLVYLLILTINFILGLSCVGLPIISVNVMICGFFIGCMNSVTYMNYYQNAEPSIVIYRMIISVILSVILLYSSEISCVQTQKITANLLNFSKNSGPDIRIYLFKYLILLVLCVFASLVSGLILT